MPILIVMSGSKLSEDKAVWAFLRSSISILKLFLFAVLATSNYIISVVSFNCIWQFLRIQTLLLLKIYRNLVITVLWCKIRKLVKRLVMYLEHNLKDQPHCKITCLLHMPELQIRGGTQDDSKINFLTSQWKRMLWPLIGTVSMGRF